MQRSSWMLAVLWPLTAAACGGDDDRGSVAVVTRECKTLPNCSIAVRACQQAVLDITACVRGDDTPALPAIRSLTRDQLCEELIAEQSSSGSDAADASALLAVSAIEKTLEAFHLVTAAGTLTEAATDEQAGSIAAFYREEQRDVTVVSDTTMDEQAAMNELAHEFTHYLQDEAGQLAAAHKTGITIDESVARRALVEGEAVVNSYRASAQMMGYGAMQVRWRELFSSIASNVAKATNASDSPFLAALNQLVYVVSPPTIEDLWEAGMRSRVDRLFAHPPLTGLDWLNDNAGSGDSLAEKLDCYPPLPPDGYELVGTDSLGVLGVYALLATQKAASLDAAEVWRGDALAVYSASASDPSDPQVLAVWRMRFKDASAADRFATSIGPLQLAVSHFGRELAISVSSDAGQPPLAAAALAACPSQAQLMATQPRTSMSMRSAASRWLRPLPVPQARPGE